MEDATEVRVKEVPCKTALTASALAEYDWALNPYRGCTGGCGFCYSPAVLRIPRDEWGRSVEVRTTMPNVLARELKRLRERKKKGVVGISTVTDPYQGLERRFGLTRFCLQQLLRFDMPVSIITKNALVVRDLDLLTGFSMPEVGISVTTLDDSQRRVMEPGTSSVDERFETLEKCAASGVRTYAFLGPYYPTAGADELERLVERLAGAGVKEAIFDGLTIKDGVKEGIMKRIGDLHPGASPEEKDAAGRMGDAFGALFEQGPGQFYRRMYAELEGHALKAGVKLTSFKDY